MKSSVDTIMESERWTHVSPPNVSSSIVPTEDNSKLGQKLLGLIRYMEKEEDVQRKEELSYEILTDLQQLIHLYSRRGLLLGIAARADAILACNDDAGGAGNGNQSELSLKKKRGRRSSNNANQAEATASPSVASTTVSDETLVITALLRILGGTEDATKLLPSVLPDMVRLSANVLTAISMHLASSTRNRIGKAELEVLSLSGIPLLKGISKTIQRFLEQIFPQALHSQDRSTILLNAATENEEEEVVQALKACFRAAATLVALFGTKLSRSFGLMTELRRIGWTALTAPQNDVQYAASQLLANLPLSGALQDKKDGGGSKTTPSEQWSQCFLDSTTTLARILSTMTPNFNQQGGDATTTNSSQNTTWFLEDLASFFQRHRDDMEEKRLSSACCFLVFGFSQLIMSLLKREGAKSNSIGVLVDAQIPTQEILALMEYMLTFASASERIYNATKKRLRFERMEGGIVNPTTLVTEVAGYVQLMGHKIINVFMSSMGFSPLLPHSKRILRMVSGAVVSSSSISLRKVVDSSKVSNHLDDKKKRWLHTSIVLRTEAIRSFSGAISMFGLEPARSRASDASSWVPSQKSSSAEQSVTLIGGCLLEQLRWNGIESMDWGTLEERLVLALEAIQSLNVIVTSCGGFMALPVRCLLDSIAASCLYTIVSGADGPIIADSSVKVAALELGSACLSSPWPIGTSSSIMEQLRRSAQHCQMLDTNTSVAAAAALRLCDIVATPRVPALYVDTKRHDLTSEISPTCAIALADDTQSAECEQKERAARLADDLQEEQEAKRRKVADYTERRQSQERESNERKKAHADQLTRKSDEATNLKHNEANFLPTTVPKVESSMHIPAQEQRVADENEGVDESAEGEEILPGIIDNDGPDEDDM